MKNDDSINGNKHTDDSKKNIKLLFQALLAEIGFKNQLFEVIIKSKVNSIAAMMFVDNLPGSNKLFIESSVLSCGDNNLTNMRLKLALAESITKRKLVYLTILLAFIVVLVIPAIFIKMKLLHTDIGINLLMAASIISFFGFTVFYEIVKTLVSIYFVFRIFAVTPDECINLFSVNSKQTKRALFGFDVIFRTVSQAKIRKIYSIYLKEKSNDKFVLERFLIFYLLGREDN
ncbi:MAG: hypothetical protein BroJett040_00740 [Oligoflexia bacterium]|nr:MAG: hypothetical protein BroJett040_00740 [Oligoflexia bacterium]